MQFRYILLAFLLLFSISVDAVRPRMSVISSRKRDGYECRLIEFNTDRNERIRAYLLVPDSSCLRKRPAVLMLHDHGARFDIGKEKLVCPAADAPVRIRNSSRQWVEKYFDGVYFGDRLASEGYVVLVADALYWGERSSPDACRWSELSYGDGQDPGSLRYGMPEERLEAEKKRLAPLPALRGRDQDRCIRVLDGGAQVLAPVRVLPGCVMRGGGVLDDLKEEL